MSDHKSENRMKAIVQDKYGSPGVLELREIDKNYNPKVEQWFDARFLPK